MTAPLHIYVAMPGSAHSRLARSSVWHRHLTDTLRTLGHAVTLCPVDLDALFPAAFPHARPPDWLERRAAAEERIVADVTAVHRHQPLDLFFGYLYASCISPAGVQAIRALGIPTVNFSCNNILDFHTVAEIAPAFDACMVPERLALPNFQRVGARALHIQMGANPAFCRDTGRERDVPLSFLGSRYADRASHVAALVRAGLPVQVWGVGWAPEGAGGVASGAARAWRDGGIGRLWRAGWRRLAEFRTRRACAGVAHGGVGDDELVALLDRSAITLSFCRIRDPARPGAFLSHVRMRDFEAPMAGACYLAEDCDELREYYEPEREIVTFRDTAELVDKARYYLAHDAERERVRRAGRARALAEHTWAARFAQLFQAIGLAAQSPSG